MPAPGANPAAVPTPAAGAEESTAGVAFAHLQAVTPRLTPTAQGCEDVDIIGTNAGEYDTGFSNETDSFDEEVELLRCQADLVEAAAEIGGTTSADDELLTTDPDLDDEEEGPGGGRGGLSALPAVRPWRPWQRSSVASVVIEEDEEGISSGFDDDLLGFEVGSSEIRSRLWAQSLLRLKRSIDEIYSLCEFESDEALCEQVRAILETASCDFDKLVKQLDAQQEYSLLSGEYPFKSGVAWTTRTPRASKGTDSVLEHLDCAQGSPAHSVCSGRRPSASLRPGDPLKRRSRSADPRGPAEAGTGEAAAGDERPGRDFCSGSVTGSQGSEENYGGATGREDQLRMMVQSALRRIHSRLGRTPSRPSPEELQKRSEDRQRRAQQVRASQDDQRMMQGRQTESRIMAARERRQEREQVRQRELLEKMTRARRQYQDQLRIICQRARKQNSRAAEVAFIAKEAIKSEREVLKQKQANAHISRAVMREQMRKRLIESAERVARVSENRRKQLESWQIKVQQELEEKERLASQRRREHIHSIKVKSQGHESRSEIVRGKRRELQEEDERSSQDFMRFKSKTIGRLALDCDGLPDAVREEVAEQFLTSNPAPAGPTRRSSAPSSAGARRKNPAAARPCTPPPGGCSPPLLSSPKGSPPSAARVEPQDFTEARFEEQMLTPLPELRLLDEPQEAAASASPREAAPGREARKARSPPPPSHVEAQCSDSPTSQSALNSSGVGAKPRAKRSSKGPLCGEHSQQRGVSPNGSAQQGEERMLAGSDGASDGFEDEPASEGDAPDAMPNPQADQEAPAALAQQLEALRARLAGGALPDEEALRLASEPESTKLAGASTAHRARLSKLAADLKKLLGAAGGSGTVVEDALVQQPSSAQSINFERADAVLADFCKVLGQSQREADFALVLKLGCAGMVVDICLRIKDSLSLYSGNGERSPSPAWRQISNVMLSALKWLGLVCKHEFARVFMLLTNRVVLLADVALACLDSHFRSAVSLPDAQSVSVLFLPQVLHVLSLHVKQTLPNSSDGLLRTLVSYLLLCGLSEQLRDLFRRAEIRGMRLFDGASPVPLLLLRAMGFLCNLISAYRLAPEQLSEGGSSSAGDSAAAAPVLEMLRRTELFGIVSVLVSILLCEGRREKSPSVTAARLPQTVISLAYQAVRILNNVARVDLATLQETVGACRRQELYHLLVCLIDYCTSRIKEGKPGQEKGQEENELLHETIVLLGYYCLQQEENQSIMCYGEGQTLLAKITSLPLHYFMEERGRGVLFPTILATCFRSAHNLELLRNEMNLSLLRTFLTANQQKEETRPPESASSSGFGGRFPAALWHEAQSFFSDEAQAPGDPGVEVGGPGV